jgi:hypothetical protein
MSAKFFDEENDTELFQLVLKHMVHGPCTHNQCLNENGQCTKHFP